MGPLFRRHRSGSERPLATELALAFRPVLGALIVAQGRALPRLRFGDRGVTASFGYAGLGPGRQSPETLVRAADRALYEAKQQGRNRRVAADHAQTPTAWITAI